VIKLTPEQEERLERFLAAFNAIERELAEALGLTGHKPFRMMVHDYEQKHPGWVHAPQLYAFADLRNLLVHETTEVDEAIAVPTETSVEEIEAIRHKLEGVAGEVYAKKVLTVQVDDSLTSVLQSMKRNDFTHFPVYEDVTFKGLLTDNGIARWLARHLDEQGDTIHLRDVRVGDALGQQEGARNYVFITPHEPIVKVARHFSTNPLLEGALITADGKPTRNLLGIATRWDMLELSGA
jgi:CBS domain-containing protein